MLGDASERMLAAELEKAFLLREASLFGHPVVGARICDQDFQEIKARLWSSGLIRKSERQRPPETYWRLTARGKDRLRRIIRNEKY